MMWRPFRSHSSLIGGISYVGPSLMIGVISNQILIIALSSFNVIRQPERKRRGRRRRRRRRRGRKKKKKKEKKKINNNKNKKRKNNQRRRKSKLL